MWHMSKLSKLVSAGIVAALVLIVSMFVSSCVIMAKYVMVPFDAPNLEPDSQMYFARQLDFQIVFDDDL